MNFFLLNVLLAIAWAALNGDFSPEYLVAGFLLGYAILWTFYRALGSDNYLTRVPRVIYFFFYFLWELFQANLRVLVEVITPRIDARPAIVAVPLDITEDTQITLLVQLLTLTPGSLPIDISSDRRVLYIHMMYVDDLDEARESVKQGFEKQIVELFR